jgi:hypothetical protein
MSVIDDFEVVYIDKDSITYQNDLKTAETLYDKSSELNEQVRRGAPLNWRVLSMIKSDILYMKNEKMISIMVFVFRDENNIEIVAYASIKGHGSLLFKYFLDKYMDKNIFLTNGIPVIQQKYLTYIIDGRPLPQLEPNGIIIWKKPLVVKEQDDGAPLPAVAQKLEVGVQQHTNRPGVFSRLRTKIMKAGKKYKKIKKKTKKKIKKKTKNTKYYTKKKNNKKNKTRKLKKKYLD